MRKLEEEGEWRGSPLLCPLFARTSITSDSLFFLAHNADDDDDACCCCCC